MTTKKVTTKKGAKKPTAEQQKELDDFAHHLAEALRIARISPAISSKFYNDLADAWNNHVNVTLDVENFWDSEDYIRLVLCKGERKRKEGKAE